MDAAALSTEGPIAFTEEDTESMALLDALIASPVFFPMSFPASFMPAAEVFEYVANASAAALLACAEFAERALPASWAAARAASALAAEPACECDLRAGRRARGAIDALSTGERRPPHAVAARQTWKAPHDDAAPHPPAARAATRASALAQRRHGAQTVTSATAGAKAAHDRGPRIFEILRAPRSRTCGDPTLRFRFTADRAEQFSTLT